MSSTQSPTHPAPRPTASHFHPPSNPSPFQHPHQLTHTSDPSQPAHPHRPHLAATATMNALIAPLLLLVCAAHLAQANWEFTSKHPTWPANTTKYTKSTFSPTAHGCAVACFRPGYCGSSHTGCKDCRPGYTAKGCGTGGSFCRPATATGPATTIQPAPRMTTTTTTTKTKTTTTATASDANYLPVKNCAAARCCTGGSCPAGKCCQGVGFADSSTECGGNSCTYGHCSARTCGGVDTITTTRTSRPTEAPEPKAAPVICGEAFNSYERGPHGVVIQRGAKFTFDFDMHCLNMCEDLGYGKGREDTVWDAKAKTCSCTPDQGSAKQPYTCTPEAYAANVKKATTAAPVAPATTTSSSSSATTAPIATSSSISAEPATTTEPATTAAPCAESLAAQQAESLAALEKTARAVAASMQDMLQAMGAVGVETAALEREATALDEAIKAQGC